MNAQSHRLPETRHDYSVRQNEKRKGSSSKATINYSG